MFNSIVEAVFHYAEAQPEKLCLADDNSKVTYAEYAELISRYAYIFAKDGIGANDNVVIEATQTVNYLAIELALQLIGAVFVPVENMCAPVKISGFSK